MFEKNKQTNKQANKQTKKETKKKYVPEQLIPNERECAANPSECKREEKGKSVCESKYPVLCWLG